MLHHLPTDAFREDTPVSTSIPQLLRERLEDSFDENFHGVRIRPSGIPEAVGVVAFAFGNSVHVASWFFDLLQDIQLEILAHECAHLLQQREGRSRENARFGNIPACLDDSLEAEASAIAKTVVQGGKIRRFRLQDPARRCIPVAQPLISIRGELVKFAIRPSPSHKRTIATTLSEKFVKTLGFVDGSMEWLNWAANKTARTYAADDELTFLLEMTEGLHNSPLLRLPAVPLVIHAARLWDLPSDHYFTLLNPSADRDAVNGVLAANALARQDALESATDYFRKLLPTNSTHLAGMTLGDQIALAGLQVGFETGHMHKAAISNTTAFASAHAANLGEFVDAANLYLTVGLKSSFQIDSKLLQEKAREAWRSIMPFAVRYLNSPSLGAGWRRDRLHPLLKNWIESGGTVGFKTAASAVFNIAAHSSWFAPKQKAADKEALVTEYMTAAQGLLYSAQPTFLGMSQDGEFRRFLLSDGTRRGVIAVDSLGTVTLESFTVNHPPI